MRMRVLLAVLVFLCSKTHLHAVSEGTGNDRHQVRQCIEAERVALLNFKQGLVDPSNYLSSWTNSSNQDCCTWTTIRCDNQTNHVIMLDFTDTGFYEIGGVIGPSLVELQYLEHLDFSWNHFTQIPKFLGSFKRLTYLGLISQISGTIPSQLGNLTKLQFLSLGSASEGSSQLIVDNLEWLSHLPSLTSFELYGANFTKAGFQSFQMPPSLSALQLSLCQFPEVNTSSLSHINSSDSLKTLSMVGNSIRSSTINWLLNSSSDLVDLTLSANYVIGIVTPFSLGKLAKLEHLDLDLSQMIADNLEWLAHLPSLTTFSLSSANFTKAGIQSFKLPPSLSSLELWGCQFPQVDSVLPLSFPNSSNFLTSLSMYDSPIHPSAIAWFLNSSSNLVNLTIESCSIDGSLPNSFQKLNSLERFDLLSNRRLGNQIPKSLGNLTNLHTFDLGGNNLNRTLQDLLESLSGCLRNSLKFLYLEDNQLGGMILDDDGTFPSVQVLDLSYNLLDGPFPSSLSRFPNLVAFYLVGNRLTGSLPDLSTMSSLRVFDASYNKFNGTLTESIGQLHNLARLDISSNSLVGIVSEVHFLNLLYLKHLDLSSNSLTFRFNSNWLPSFQLTGLCLGSCKLGPEFPKWLRNQFNLSRLDISNSGISDAIPNWFSNISLKLQYLDLSSNLINSTLPNFPLMSGAFHVNLSFNQFHGPVPLSLSNAMKLYLSNNTFSGFTSFLCGTTDAATSVLDLSNNLLFGSLPDCWGNLKYLGVLKLDNNELSGVIPSSIALLNQLTYLNLRHNNFSGSVPPLLKNCTNLQVLQAGENNWKGEIPTWIGESLMNLVFLGGHGRSSYTTTEFIIWKGVEYKFEEILGLLRIIDLSSNRLIGEIPKELKNLAELVQLNLSRNYLSGAIPKNIGMLNNLESLDLSHNKLCGKIPESLAQVSTLDYLDLSCNRLSGRIPTSTQLQSFNASSYRGNLELCGQPLTLVCPGDETFKGAPNSNEDYVEDGGESLDMSWLRLGIGVGFAVGFCGVCGNLLLYTSWRLAYFRFLDDLGDWLYVIIAVKWTTFKRRFSR
ncbi:hypothetical protein TIFTF001_033486 [Ficus carica]|uniref:Leucine-rich repeat-containing N-terminal plant-type domain-containing protein n=1 Tax=Ficus carica TaxID=3494 RepID=A0AA88DYY1_FICCA|nr:hypothetical protein TIFTF001_033486 [Ficus carica]